MHSWAGALLNWYFAILGQFGLQGVAIMTSLAVPSELVIPPAAYVEVYQKSHNLGSALLLLLLVILAGAVGFTISACIVYWAVRGLGRPLITRYGKYCLLPEKKLKLAERWVAHYGAGSILLVSCCPASAISCVSRRD